MVKLTPLRTMEMEVAEKYQMSLVKLLSSINFKKKRTRSLMTL